jgi:acetyl-CoA acetyltransferase
MTESAWIAGAGMTPVGVRRDCSVRQLVGDAVLSALADAGIEMSGAGATLRQHR